VETAAEIALLVASCPEACLDVEPLCGSASVSASGSLAEGSNTEADDDLDDLDGKSDDDDDDKSDVPAKGEGAAATTTGGYSHMWRATRKPTSKGIVVPFVRLSVALTALLVAVVATVAVVMRLVRESDHLRHFALKGEHDAEEAATPSGSPRRPLGSGIRHLHAILEQSSPHASPHASPHNKSPAYPELPGLPRHT